MPAHHFSASKSALAQHCRYPFRSDIPRPPYRKRRDALVGIAIHYAIAHTIDTRDTECAFEDVRDDETLSDAEVEKVAATHATWLVQWWAHHSHEGWRAEVAIGFAPVSGLTRVLDTKERRAYDELDDSYVPGTTDIVRYDAETETVYIFDHKSGGGHNLAARPAGENPQLATLAVSFAAHYGAKRAIVGIDKVRPSGVTVDDAPLSPLDLAEHRVWLAEVLAAIPGAEPIKGPHCYSLYCDHCGTCPATRGALAVVAPPNALDADRVHLPIVTNAAEIQSADHARYQYETLRAAQAALAAAWEALRAWADGNGGVPVANGLTWMRRVSARESIDLDVVGATNALEHVLGPAWRTAVEMSTSKTAIERAVRPIALANGTPIAALKRQVIDALRVVGAVTAKQSVSYEEIKATDPDQG